MRLTDQGDEELAVRARTEPRPAFGVLFERHRTALWNFLLKQGIDEVRAEDLFQTTFLKAFRSIGSFQERSSFKTWLYRIAINLVMDEARNVKRHGRTVPLTESMLQKETYSHEDVNEAETAVRAREALAQLPPEERRLFTLVRFQELTIPEAARAMGITHSAARMKLFRVRKKIGERLALLGEKT